MNPQLPIRTGMAALLAVAALLAAAGPAPAQPQDLRTPDAPDLSKTSSVAGTTSDMFAQDQRSPDARDAGTSRVPNPGPPTWPVDPKPIVRPAAPARTSDGSADGFQWDDAAIGAGGTLGLVLILAGGTAAISRRHRTAERLATP